MNWPEVVLWCVAIVVGAPTALFLGLVFLDVLRGR